MEQKKITENSIPVFEHERMRQNRKILRYRACLAQLAVVCVNLKNLNGELLSYQFCQLFREKVNALNAIRGLIQLEIQEQSLTGQIKKLTGGGNRSSFTGNSHALINQRNVTLRSRFLTMVHSFCEVLLSELHILNYEYISDRTYEALGELMDLYANFRHEIVREQDLQSQRRPEKILQKVA